MICNQEIPENKCPNFDCGRSDCGGCPFRKIVIPAAAGDDETGEVVPENGLFTNALVEYEANGAMYIYASDGIYTRIGSSSKSEDAASTAYVDSRFMSLKRYTDSEIDEASDAITLYVDGADATTLAEAKSYTDDKTDGLLDEAKDYADTQDAAVLQAAKDYTDSAASSVVTRTYVDTGDANSLQSAKDYTDAEIASLEGDLAAVATTGSYTDLSNAPSIPVVTLTTVDPGEGQPLAANHFIGVYQ